MVDFRIRRPQEQGQASTPGACSRHGRSRRIRGLGEDGAVRFSGARATQRRPVTAAGALIRHEPVSVLGAWRNAHGQGQLDELFTGLGKSFSDCTSYAFELLAYDVVGDIAYTAGFEHTSAAVDGQPRTYSLRATQV